MLSGSPLIYKKLIMSSSKLSLHAAQRGR